MRVFDIPKGIEEFTIYLSKRPIKDAYLAEIDTNYSHSDKLKKFDGVRRYNTLYQHTHHFINETVGNKFYARLEYVE